MKTDQIRDSFVSFFEGHGHTSVKSSTLAPADDPTLLFTNAGMVQFKRVFQGLEHRDYNRAVTVQKCVRAGGKHNDLEQVGHTDRHHTFFEMLGNFSFGNYFKREAIEFAWEWVAEPQYLGIDPDRLYVTVHHTDDEAARLWHQVTRISDRRVYRLGDKDNFWQMGDTGPCGPCSEIYVDLRSKEEGRGTDLSQDDFEELAEAGRFLEIWNLVFMQFDQAKDGSRTRLPAPSVDTGAGLERIASVMQDVPSNFDTDLFTRLIGVGEGIIGRPYDCGPGGAGFRVLADHARAVAFLLADGVYPSNDGRGYVLRRVLRRAVRHAYLLGRRDPTLVHIVAAVVEAMGDTYPELAQRSTHIADVTQKEEERFLETIEGGLSRLDELTAGAPGTISGDDAFKLYDTFGFPIDLTTIAAGEKGWKVDERGFERALDAQRERSRAIHTGGAATAGTGADAAGAVGGVRPGRRTTSKGSRWTTVTPRKRQRFVGYEATAAETDILKFRRNDDRIDLILHENPFYAESGGQVSDTGVIRGEGWELPVDDVLRIEGKQVVTGPFDGPFEPTPVQAVVKESRRRDIERNHTATHLVHASLRARLGEHVRQAGSVVAPDRLRFDFSHHAPVTDDDLALIEEDVNQNIWDNIDITTRLMSYRDALAEGAMALFGEKYGDLVRVVDVAGVSLELCGGTHVRSTGQIGLFRFTSESGVAAGVRRVEAVTGPGAYDVIRALGSRISEAAQVLRTHPEHLTRRIESLLSEHKRLEKQIEDLLRSGGGGGGDWEEQPVDGIRVFSSELAVVDRQQVGMLMDQFREKHSRGVAVLIATGDRPGIHVAVTDDLIQAGLRAGDVVSKIAEVTGGRGGGRPHFASAGVGDVDKLAEAKRQAPEIVRSLLPA